MTKRTECPKRRRQPSIREVAREAGVSIAAASYALNGRGGVAEATRKRVLKAVEKLNYQPNKSAQSMRTGRTDAIGLILPDLCNPFFPEFAKSVQQSAAISGKSVFLIDTNNDSQLELNGVQRLLRQGIDGLIWWPTEVRNAHELGHLARAMVLVDAQMDGVDSVTCDHSRGGEMLADFVKKSGLTKVGIVRGSRNFSSAAIRRKGFVDSIGKSIEIVWEIENSFSPPINDELKARVGNPDVDVIICPNDLIAIEVIRHIKACGMRVPEDVAVTGFGDIHFANLVSPALTTIHQPLAELGRQSMELLVGRMAEPDSAFRHIVLPVHLVVRESAADSR